jgi:Zn-dependent protease with chaperone function
MLVAGIPTKRLYRNRVVSGVLMLLLGVVFVACGMFAALPLATLRSLILDPIGLTVPFSWVLGLGAAFVLGGLLMVASRLRDAQRMIAMLPQARPAEDPALVQTVAELSDTAGLKVAPPLLVLASMEPNAFAYGIGRDSSSIAITQGMIDLLDTDELQGVLAHELSHVANEDTRLITLVEAFNQTSRTLRRVADQGGFNIGFTDAARYAPFLAGGAAVLYLANRFVPKLAQSPQEAGATSSTESLNGTATTLLHLLIGACLMLVALVLFFKLAKIGWRTIVYISLFVLVGFVPFIEVLANPAIGVLLGCGISRQREFIADANAAGLTGDPLALAGALRKLEAHPITTVSHLIGARYAMFSPVQAPAPRRWWARLYATHPTLQARRERLEALALPASRPDRPRLNTA